MRAPVLVLGLAAAVTLAVAPVSPASAREHWHHGGRGFGLIGGVAALATGIVIGAATIATTPVRVLGDALAAPAYAPAPAYYAQAPAYAPAPAYAQAPAYAPAPQAYYPPPQPAPQAYYYPPPAAPAGYPPPANAYPYPYPQR